MGRCATRLDDARQRGIVAAMTSRLGAGPAAFRREGGEPRYVDTVYLGAFRASTIREIGGYDEWSGGNEDAELAWRAQRFGGVYLDPSIKSYYLGRDGLGPFVAPVLPVRPQPRPHHPQAPRIAFVAPACRSRALCRAGEPVAAAGAGGLRRDRSRARRPRAHPRPSGRSDASRSFSHDACGLGAWASCGGIVGTGGSVRLLAPGTGSQEKLFLAGRTTSLGSG